MSDQAPTVDQLRHKIDSGATGDKINWPDPAAAPLGTDAEAGGSRPTATERRIAFDNEVKPKAHGDAGATDQMVYLCLVAVFGVAILSYVAFI
jgi:hypothetical protein